MDELHRLAAAVRQRAADLGLPVIVDPPELCERRLWAADLADRLDGGSGAPEEAASPTAEEFVALAIGYHRLLIGSLGLDSAAAAVGDRLLRYHNQAAIAWSWLGAAGEDLLLFLVTTRGSDEDPDWERIAHEIERNEQICRKLVWRPPADEAADEGALSDFMDRTFLARPWHVGAAGDAGALDRLALLPKALAKETFLEAEAARWLEVLARDDQSDAERARALIDALEPSHD